MTPSVICGPGCRAAMDSEIPAASCRVLDLLLHSIAYPCGAQAQADIESQCGDVASARQLMQQAAAMPAANAQTLVFWAKWEERQGDALRAKHLCIRALQLDPKSAPALQVPSTFLPKD